MKKNEKSIKRTIFTVCSKIVLAAGVVVAFYKLPSIVAEKINYLQLKKKVIKQDLTEDE